MPAQTYSVDTPGRTRLSWERYTPDGWRASLDAWARFHGIDPAALPSSGWVEVDHARHSIEFTIGVCALCTREVDWPGCSPRTEVVQGEGPPLLLPGDLGGLHSLGTTGGDGWRLVRS